MELLYDLCVWFMQTYGDYNYVPEPYVVPVDMVVNLEDLEQENKELEARNKQLLIELQTIQQQGKADSNRRAVAYSKALALKLTEAQTRELIDDQLRNVSCGKDLTYVVNPLWVFFRSLITNLELILHRAVGNHDRLLVVF